MKRFVALFILAYVIIIAGCAASQQYSTTVKQNLTSAQAQATNAAIAENDSAQSAQATRAARADQVSQATAQSNNATRAAIDSTEQARQVIARATDAARADAAGALTLEQAQAAATATRAALGRQMSIDAQEAKKIEAETQATITAANEAATTAKQTAAYRNDFFYILPDLLMRYAPCGVILLAGALIWYLVRAIAARIAGDEGRARTALMPPSITVIWPTPLLPAPRDDDDDDEGETGNTDTEGNSGNSEGNSGETVFPVNDRAGSHPVLNMTREEYHEIVDLRRKSIDLLARCVDYYRENNAVDDGTIPRHDKIHMQPENRGAIVDGLWYSSYVIKTKNKTLVDPHRYPTCAALLEAIKSGHAKVYPLNYFESKQARLENAISTLPQGAGIA